MEFLAPIADFVSRVGFPVFVAVWLLARIDPALRRLTESIIALHETLKIFSGKGG